MIMKIKKVQLMASVLLVGLSLLFFSGCSSWKKKQFESDEEFVSAFKHAKYKDIKKEFGEPYYKFLDVTDQEITYRWHGVGVKGQSDAYLVFSAFEYGTYNFSGYEFKTWYSTNGYHAPSNDKTYNID